MARGEMDQARPGDTLLVIHEFNARSPDELTLKRGDRIELIERDDDFGDGWFLGRHSQNGATGLFPEVYTQLAPRPSFTSNLHARPAPQYHASPVHSLNGKSSEPALATIQREESLVEPLAASFHDSSGQRSSSAPIALQPGGKATPFAHTISIPPASQKGSAMGNQASPVMNETLSVIDEHLTDIHTPRTSGPAGDRRPTNDSSSEYSSHVDHRLSYINGTETDEEEQSMYTLAEVRSWSPERVAEWLEDVGVEKRHCDVFREQEISGEVLLGMDQPTIFMKEFDLGPIGPRLRTWQKIKALQQEVSDVQPGAEQAEPDHSATKAARHRSSSIGTVLPRIPSLMDPKSARPSSKQQLSRASSQAQSGRLGSGVAPSSPATPGLGHSRRPSAASVREYNQHRRHSSIEFTPEPATPTTITTKPLTASPTAHRKIPSFDRGWIMGDPKPPSRPASSAQMRPTTGEESPGENVLGPNDLDRGYFSGNEAETRKHRNVLRKSHSPTRSRTGSISIDGRRLSAAFGKRHSRVGSKDSNNENVEPTIFIDDIQSSPSPRSKSARAASGPELRTGSPRITKDRSQTVTKLDYGAPSIDAIASSPNLVGSDTESNGRASPPPAIARHPKQRATGLRAISDAISGNMLSLGSIRNAPASPTVKDAPPSSPARTGSSTPSATSKSFELNEPPHEVLRSATGNSMTPSTSSGGNNNGKKKSKKETSAYQRGLEQKSPQEQIDGADYSGWMKKRSSNIMATWKTRLFVLRGRRLSYYYSEFDTAEKGLIDISGHRVLPANNERMAGLHAAVTGAKSSPTSPQNASLATAASTDAANALDRQDDASGMFIFKLMPPRTGLSKAVNFTKPTVHYFAVDNVQQGRLWMAALMKATIDRDDTKEVVSTYQQKTISLAKARQMQQRPPNLMGEDGEEDDRIEEAPEEEDAGFTIAGADQAEPSLRDTVRSSSIDASDATTGAAPESTTTTSLASETEQKE
ncbi:uncharacterized protein K452DRAFT_231705 [Aplosporella prunicola CBS 121167]|uniref:Polarized growth protein Boi2 n=1 Tax=Aplosporella prunicola CBS 121167 TaxID=1176127 RepID=A0A6A6BAX7_9PEZI|nr:uncharacterized protein K452DRAFT_231705 [Aplosporella prunicola CBS 121167]KAF2140067.1 hypothetical protein K452DRAFT_231705 [Aplosporella prunicola CBS 121167]